MPPLGQNALPEPSWCSNGIKFVTTQITSGISFITAYIAYTSTNKTQIIWIKRRACFRVCFNMLLPVSLVSTQTFRRVLAASVDNSVEIRSAPFCNQLWQTLEEGCQKVRHGRVHALTVTNLIEISIVGIEGSACIWQLIQGHTAQGLLPETHRHQSS